MDLLRVHKSISLHMRKCVQLPSFLSIAAPHDLKPAEAKVGISGSGNVASFACGKAVCLVQLVAVLSMSCNLMSVLEGQRQILFRVIKENLCSVMYMLPIRGASFKALSMFSYILSWFPWHWPRGCSLYTRFTSGTLRRCSIYFTA